ncbi:hypothetical protein [Chryseobacterium sp. POE27]|uniref:hypothetical protein n=1 Tax=Chryseobacterium sp. POE27 TaxID=3138177 RepID=UPI00321C2E30
MNFDLKSRIKEYLLSGSSYYAKKIVELLYSDDINFFKELTDLRFITPKMYFLDFVLGLLIKNKENSFVEKFLIVYYDVLIQNGMMEETNIIKNLILSNSDLGFRKLKELIAENPFQYISIESHFNFSTWQQFSNKNSIDDLIIILNLGLLNYSIDQIQKAHFSPVRISTEAIISICNNQSSATCDLILDKIEQMNTDLILEKCGDLFYINKLKKRC